MAERNPPRAVGRRAWRGCLLAAILLAGCAAPPEEVPAPLAGVSGAPPGVAVEQGLVGVCPGGGGNADAAEPVSGYAIDPQRSRLQIFVFRGGRLARLGHSHVISSPELSGRLVLGATLRRSRVDLAVPVASLVVDDAAQRQAAGPEFATRPTPQEIAATRRNLLGPRVLDAERYPLVKVRGRWLGGEPPDLAGQLEIEVRGERRCLPVSVRVESRSAEVVVVGEVRMLQSDFGIQPFSILMGGLRVRDELLIRFRLVAVRG